MLDPFNGGVDAGTDPLGSVEAERRNFDARIAVKPFYVAEGRSGFDMAPTSDGRSYPAAHHQFKGVYLETWSIESRSLIPLI